MRNSLLITFGFGLSIATAATAQTFEIEYSFDPNHRANTFFIDLISSEMESRSQGKMKFAGISQRNQERSTWERLVKGDIEIAFASQADAYAYFPRTLLAGLSGGLTDPFDITERFWYESTKSLDIEYQNVKLLALCASSSAGLLSKTPINSIEDLKGMRIAPYNTFASPLIEAWESIPTETRSDALTTFTTDDLDAAIVDLTELKKLMASTDASLHFIENFPVQTRPYFLAMNHEAYNKLSTGYGKSLINSFTEVDTWMNCTETFVGSEEAIAAELENIPADQLSRSFLPEVARSEINEATNKGLQRIFGNIRAQGVYDHDQIYRALSQH